MSNRAGKHVLCGIGDAAYKCFVPQTMPPEDGIRFDEDMIYLLSESGRQLGRLDELTDSLISPNYFVYMYARKEAALSSQIEGTRATFTDLIRKEAGFEDGPDDVQEIENYIRAIRYGFQRLEELPLSLRLIREIHAVLMQDVRGQHKDPGEFRRSQNWIGGASIKAAYYVPPSVEHMWSLLDNLEKFIYAEDRLHPIVKAALIHSQFEMIHPFLDGNGRTGRLLITLYLACKGMLHKPTLYLSGFFLRNRAAYYARLANIQERGDYESWIRFFLQGIVDSCSEAVELARRIQTLKEADSTTIRTLGRSAQHALKLHETLFDKPTVTIDQAATLLGVAYTTAGRVIERMVELGILSLLGERKRGRVFIYARYVNIFEI